MTLHLSSIASVDDPPPAFGPFEIEQAVLGTLLANNRALERCGPLAPEHFTHPAHSRIFELIVRRIKAGRLADAVTLKPELSGALEEVGGSVYLAELLAAMVSAERVEGFAREITMNAAERGGGLVTLNKAMDAALKAIGMLPPSGEALP